MNQFTMKIKLQKWYFEGLTEAHKETEVSTICL